MIIPDFVERSNRRTLSLQVLRNGSVCVKAPINMKDEQINKFVAEKQGWIQSKLAFINENRNKFEEVIAKKCYLIYGNKYNLVYGDTKTIKTSQNFEIVLPAKITSDKITKNIKNWYKKAAKQILAERIALISKNIGLIPLKIKIGDSRGRWGSCSSNKTIVLNYRVLMLPPMIIDYVLIHELCHLKEMNHSRVFWNLVASFMPNYEKAKSAIKEYGFLLSLYN